MTKLYPILLVLILASCSEHDANNQIDTLANNQADRKTSDSFQDDTLSATPLQFTDTILNFSTGSFPESWDANHNLRAHGEMVLTWERSKNDRGREWKSCIVLSEFLDSLGKKNYCISMENTHEKPFDEWHTAWIDYAPDSVSLMGFNDLLLECYDHKPTKKELDKLLARFMFELSSERYLTLEAGIDVELWKSTFGYYPSNLLPNQ